MRPRHDQLASLSIIVAALAVVFATASRLQWGRRGDVSIQLAGPPTYVPEWQTIGASGRRFGSATAPMTVIVFSDLECPFCRKFHEKFKALGTPLRDSVALVFIHFPLASHRFARAAARGAECAAQQGRFERFVDVVYAHQDSIGVKTWMSFALAAGVPDTSSFTQCAIDTAQVALVEKGLLAGRHLGVSGTPTVIVNGWKYLTAPFEDLSDVIRETRDMGPGGSPSARKSSSAAGATAP